MNAQGVTRILTVLSIIAILALAFQPIPIVSAADRIFEDGFESGDFSEWDYASGTPEVTSGEAYQGTYKAVLDDAEYVQARFILDPLNHAFMRAYVMFKEFPAAGEETTVLGLYKLSSGIYMAEARVKNVAGTVKWALRYHDNGTNYVVTSELEKPELDTWYCVEVEGKANTTTDAESRIYIDGNELTDVSQTGKNNDSQIDSGYIWANTAVTRWYDDVVIDTTYIGPNLPPTTTTGVATSVTITGATLNGVVNPNDNDTEVIFQYGTTIEYGSTITATQSPVSGSSDTAVSAAITGLTANVTYHFRVVGENIGGTTNGEDATFTTAETLLVTGPISVTYGYTETITTSGGSGTGEMSYSAGVSTGCTVEASSGVITATDASGSCTVTTTKAADATYEAQSSAEYPVTLNKRAVILSGDRTYDGTDTAAYDILSIANIFGTDDVTVASGSCTLESADVGLRSITSLGTLALDGSDAGNYTLTDASGSVMITQADQETLIVTGPISVTVGSTGTITTSGGSGTGAMSYSAGASTGCTVDTSSGVITASDASGTCIVTATKAADTNYNATTSAEFPVAINPMLVFLPSVVR
jgi:hypothetical protein